jgi:hypothetical protein
MRGIFSGLGSVTVMLAGLGLCLVFAFYDALRQNLTAGEGTASVATNEPAGPTA